MHSCMESGPTVLRVVLATGDEMAGEVEVWLRGPIPGVPEPLQPVAHALLQALEEVGAIAADLPDELLWTRPGGVASAGFHLRHVSGVVDRLFTYARGEKTEPPATPVSAVELAAAFGLQVEGAVEVLRRMDETTLAQPRAVGRKALPSTVRGLLFHAAEHVQRHLGQLIVTVRVQRADEGSQP